MSPASTQFVSYSSGSNQVYDLLITIIFSFVFTWGIGLAPPLVIRYVLHKRPLEIWPAIGVCAFFWFFNIVLFSALGSRSKTHGALALIAFVSYWILRKKATTEEQARHDESVNQVSVDGTTPLMEAAMLGKIKQIQKLISAGANVDAVDENGWTPLMYAASSNEVEAAELLLQRGANPSLRNKENHTASEIAKSKENLEAFTAIQNQRAVGNTPA